MPCPFFDSRHRKLAADLEAWRERLQEYRDDVDVCCRKLVAAMGSAGFLKLCVSDGERRPDVRNLAIARETLVYHSGLADFAFAMQRRS